MPMCRIGARTMLTDNMEILSDDTLIALAIAQMPPQFLLVTRAHAAVMRYLVPRLLLREGAVGGSMASTQAFVNCLVFFAASRFTAAVACALADPATRLAALRNMLIKGFFMVSPVVVYG